MRPREMHEAIIRNLPEKTGRARPGLTPIP